MIVCVCNNLSSEDVRRAVEAGCATYEAVLEFNGCEPNCFSCQEDVVSTILNGMLIDEQV